ncbi:MAG TPA: hypothetical protein VER79_13235, partial [Candidatus Limnocylindrales bacterium]|nr:hypothetical protein [Candidatus Limnocylindrales bacterium]
MARRTLLLLLTGLAFILLAGAVVGAQVGAADSCPDLVTRALAAVNNLCTGQERNSACYGNTLVDAQFADEAASVAFNQEGDIANLGLLRSIRTSPLNDELTEWGVSVLSVQANLPGTLPGQNALFMLIGGSEIESAVDPANAFTPAAPVPVLSAAASPVAEAPQADAATVFFVDAGQSLLADAKSEDSAFVRVTLGDQFGWMAASALQPDAAIDALPVYTPGTSFSPMQAFYLRTGIGGAQCTQAPSALVVQGPENFNVQISANGADISLGSSIILETLPLDAAKDQLGKYADQPGVGGLLRITVIDGHVTITNDDGTVTEIPEGYQSTICLTDAQNLGVDGQVNDQTVTYVCGGWTEPEQIPLEFREQFSLVDDFPLNYPLDILTPTPTVPAPPPPQATATAVPTDIPTQTPWPVIPTDTPVALRGVQVVATAELLPGFGGGASVVPRFLGIGEGGSPWDMVLDIIVTNTAATPASNVAISGITPEGVEGYPEYDKGEFDWQTNTWLVGDLAPGEEAYFSLYAWVYLKCGDSISGTLNITSDTPNPLPPVVSFSVIALCNANLKVDANAGLTQEQPLAMRPRFLGIGGPQEYWIFNLQVSVTNNGPEIATNVQING